MMPGELFGQSQLFKESWAGVWRQSNPMNLGTQPAEPER
jgi:hypothetical protein